MAKKNAVKAVQKKAEKEASESTLINVDVIPNSHYIRIRGDKIDVCCSGNDQEWFSISPIKDITKEVQYCHQCGQKLRLDVTYSNFNRLIPNVVLQGVEIK